MARTNKDDFTQSFDLGPPIDISQPGYEDVLILYNSNKAMPTKKQKSETGTSVIDSYDTKEATEHCDYMNIILTSHDPGRKQCVAIVPQVRWFNINRA